MPEIQHRFIYPAADTTVRRHDHDASAFEPDYRPQQHLHRDAEQHLTDSHLASVRAKT